MKDDNEIRAVVARVKMQLAEFYNENSWVTESFSKKVLALDSSDAFKKMKGHNHSVAQLVGHITAWYKFCLTKTEW